MKIICIGRNYEEHIRELQNEIPGEMVMFIKPSTSLLVNNKHFYYPEFTKEIHYEAELVLKVCKNGKYVGKEFALSYFDEITIGVDLTARDIQKQLKVKGLPWEKSKAFDNSAIIGKFIPSSKVDLKNVSFHLTKNGETVQEGNSKDMIHSFAGIISEISRFFKLQVGDFIFTGTPAGVGSISSGDLLQGFINGKKLLQCEIR